jgi:4-hydroxybenzoate polyprenyltransferase
MVKILFKALRVYQWSKNLLVFVALIFAQQIHIPQQFLRSVLAFVAFCAASSAMYLFNDLMDVKSDRVHPAKRTRPLASGELGYLTAVFMGVSLCFIALAFGWLLGVRFFCTIIFYLGLTTLYTLILKKIAIVDVLVIAIGFVVRAMAGAIALDVSFSNWLVVCTLFLSLFLGISKRRHELQRLDAEAASHRQVLDHYTLPYLDTLILLVCGSTLITYTIYTCSPEVVVHFGTDKLYLTLPFVVYGLFRYLYLVQVSGKGGDPSRLLLKDKPLGAAVLFWAAACILIIYWKVLAAQITVYFK